jgi:iron complex outermembrane receptor protein
MNEKNRYVDSGTAIGAALGADPTQPVYDDSEVGKFFGGYYQPSQSASVSDPSWKYYPNPNATQNPLAYLNTNVCKATANDFSVNVEGDYKIHGLEDLHIHASYGGQYTDSKQTDVNSPYSYSNNYYGWDGVTRYWKYSVTANAYAQYAHDFGVHFLDVMVGTEESHFHSSGYSAGMGWDPYTNEAYNESLRSENEWATHNSLVSYFGRLNYTLLERYMLTATFRADGSSRFAEGNKWGYFPSVALAWKINNEGFLKDSEVVNDLKLRLGWGQTGQQDIGGDFLYAPLYTISNSYAQYPLGNQYYYTVRPSSYNTDLQWETTTTYNAGIDFAMLNNRITMNLDGYYRKTDDLINDVTIPVGTNFASVLKKNIGSLENYGTEFAINAKPIVKKNFTWDVTYNVAWNHNEITSLTGDDGDSDYYIKSGTTISRGNSTLIQANRVGEAVNSFFVYQQVYDENGKPIEGLYVDRNGDGQINESDKYFYKKPAADVIMGFTTKFLYKNWDLSASFHASLGNYVYYNYLSDKASISASGLYSNSAFSNTFPEAVNLGFTGTGGTEYYLSDYFVRNASFLKCSNITLGYSFPTLLKQPVSGRIFFTAQNPFIITKYKGIDPEVSSGVDKNPYPRPMSFQLGLNLNF